MSQFWNERTHKLDPYVPGEQPRDQQYVKLNTNENPYPPSPHVLKKMQEAVGGSLRLYPDPEASELKEVIARYYGLNTNQVFVGNGSDEVLALSFQAFFQQGNPILFPDITYSFYPVYCNLFELDYHLVPLEEDFSIPVEKMFEKNGGVIFPNPNAPTGKSLELDAIRKILAGNEGQVVIVDEAYIDFGGESAVSLIKDFPNLLVIQTLSKSRSLAGLRVGFALGNEELIEGLNRVKNSFNSYPLDRIAQVGATAAIEDEEYFRQTTDQVIRTRERIISILENNGFNVIPSKANFIFIHHPEKDAAELYATLKKQGVLVRYFNKPRINQYLRVSIGTDEEMDIFINKLDGILFSGN